jgi:cell division protein FtsI (penicillin-binding protein 3)
LAKRTLGEVKEYIVKVKDLTGREQDILKRDLTGLEGFFEKELSGVSGKKMTKTVSNIIIDMNDPSDILPQNGLDVVTTLDMTIQDIAHKSLLNNMKNHEADEGCVIVMEVETGDILAIANISQDRNGAYRETKNVALDEYEPGSTFKTAGLLVALNDEKITPNTKIQIAYKSGRTATVGVRNVTDDVVIDKNEAPVWEILARSSNVGTTRAIYNSYNAHQQQFFDGLCRLGFCDTIIFPVIGGKKCPLLHSPSHPMWSKSTISTVPMGYEVKVTPLHLLTFYNAIANDGKMVAPRLVSELRSGEQTVQKFDVIVLREKICSDQALQQIRGMLDSVITYTRGTGYKGFKGSLYTIAGKTGTSTDYTREAKGKNLNNASFCGYFPADNPKYSCIVLIKRPRTGGSHGGSVAIPVFRDIADKLYATDFKLMPEAEPSIQDSANFDLVAKSRISALDTIFKTVHFQMFERNNATWGYVHLKNKTAVVEQVSFSDKMMPDVTEMSPTDAVFVLEKVGLAVEIKGYGRVKRQTPEANTLIIKGQKAILELGI